MTTVRVIPFHIEHLRLMDIREYEAKNTFNSEEAFTRYERILENAEVYTIIYEGVILGCVGFFRLWGGVCEVWSTPSKYIVKHGETYARAVKRLMEDKLVGYHRIQANAIDDQFHYLWFKYLGFSSEGIMFKYQANGDNFRMWAKVV